MVKNWYDGLGLEVIGVSGKLGSGKNYVSEKVLVPMLPPKQMVSLAFADHPKVDVIVRDGVSYERVYHKKDEESRLNIQRRLTEEGRDVIGPDIWIDTLEQWVRIHAERGIRRFLIPDVRFHNELALIRKLGGIVIRVNAPERNEAALRRESGGDPEKYELIKNHRSETEADNETFDYTLLNDEGQDVYTQCRDLAFTLRHRFADDNVILCDLDDTLLACAEHYHETINECKEFLRTLWVGKAPFEIEFDTAFQRIRSGDYFQTPVTVGKLAGALNKVTLSLLPDLHSAIAIDEIEEEVTKIGMRVYTKPYDPLPGALAALARLRQLGHVVIFTMGDRAVQVRKLAMHGLTDLDFEIVDFKNESHFRHVMAKYPARNYVMIGDSYARDIEPCLNLGFERLFHITETGRWCDHQAYRSVADITQVADHLESAWA